LPGGERHGPVYNASVKPYGNRNLWLAEQFGVEVKRQGHQVTMRGIARNS
jgi:hypothetical protein